MPIRYHVAPYCSYVETNGFCSIYTLTQAVLLAVSSSSPDPLNELTRLYEYSKKADALMKQPFIDSNLPRCYLVIHDTASAGTDMSRSMALLEEVRKTYGLDCAIVHVNSAQEPDPLVHAIYTSKMHASMSRMHADDQRSSPMTSSAAKAADDSTTIAASQEAVKGARLSMLDVQRIQAYVREMITKSLVPYLERTVQQLGEHIASQRRGLTGRLLGAGRKWFSSRPSSDQVLSDHGIYPTTSLPFQTRRLADMAMHIRDYRLAAQMYEAARRDFQADQATLHSACAGEMYCLAQLLHATTTPAYHNSLTQLFLHVCDEYVSIRVGEFFALRGAVLYGTMQELVSDYEHMAMAYMRAAGFTDEIVRALLLEHASLAYLRMSRPHMRRSAAALLLAAAQYESCGQKELALRCYMRTADFYKACNTPLHDHSLFKMAHLVHSSGRMDDALAYLLPLLHGSLPELDAVLLHALETVTRYAHDTCVTLPVPLFQPGASYILPSTASDNGIPCVREKEPFHVQLTLRNPLGVKVALTNVALHFVSAHKNGHASSAQVNALGRLDDLTLGPHERRSVVAAAYVHDAKAEYVRLSHVTYTLAGMLHVQQDMSKHGKRLNSTLEQRRTRMYAPDLSLLVRVRQDMPHIDMHVDVPTHAYVGELVHIRMRLVNTSVSDISSLAIKSIPAHMQCSCLTASELELPWNPSSSFTHAAPLPALQGGQEHEITFVYHVLSPGEQVLTWVLCYENAAHEHFEARMEQSLIAHVAMQAVARVRLTARREPLYGLAIETKNCSPDTLTCDGITFVSPLWEAHTEASLPATLTAGDVLTTFVRLQPTLLPQNADIVTHMLNELHRYLSGKAYDPSLTTSMRIATQVSQLGHTHDPALTSMPSLYSASRYIQRQTELDRLYNFMPKGLAQRAFPLIGPNDVDLVLHWHDANHRRGQTLLCGVKVGIQHCTAQDMASLKTLLDLHGPSHAMYEETAREQAIIRGRLRHTPLGSVGMPLSVYANLDSVMLDQVPAAQSITLFIRNEAPWPLSFSLTLVQPTSQAGFAPWLGKLSHSGTVGAWTSCPIDVCVLVMEPGTFQLGNVQCQATLYDKEQAIKSWNVISAMDVLLVARLQV